ncbi:hypothetical protein [Deinococcus sp. PEB2-67]
MTLSAPIAVTLHAHLLLAFWQAFDQNHTWAAALHRGGALAHQEFQAWAAHQMHGPLPDPVAELADDWFMLERDQQFVFVLEALTHVPDDSPLWPGVFGEYAPAARQQFGPQQPAHGAGLILPPGFRRPLPAESTIPLLHDPALLRAAARYESGEATLTPIEDVAKRHGIELHVVHEDGARTPLNTQSLHITDTTADETVRKTPRVVQFSNVQLADEWLANIGPKEMIGTNGGAEVSPARLARLVMQHHDVVRHTSNAIGDDRSGQKVGMTGPRIKQRLTASLRNARKEKKARKAARTARRRNR